MGCVAVERTPEGTGFEKRPSQMGIPFVVLEVIIGSLLNKECGAVYVVKDAE